MGKKLDFSMAKKSIKKYDEKVRVVVDVDEKGEETFVNIFPNFSPIKMREMFQEMMKDEQNIIEQKLDSSKINRGNWFYFNVVKFFSDLDLPDDTKEKAKYFMVFEQTPYFDKIVNEYPEESLKKLADMLTRMSEEVMELTDKQVEQLQKEMEELDKNEDVE